MWKMLSFGHEQFPLSPDQQHAQTKVLLAERFGWTFDVIEAMRDADIQDIFAILNAREKAKAK